MNKIKTIEKISKDCAEKGHGRKKWWAKNLGVHQQTLSYWLNGYREPSGFRLEQANKILSILANKNDALIWADLLNQIYFSNQIKISKELIKEIIKKVLVAETIDSRTLGFISFIVKKQKIDFDEEDSLLRNRLGWLMEVSGRKPNFKPLKSGDMSLVVFPGSILSKKTINYLKVIQTEHGKRWHIYDCDIKSIARSYIGSFISTDSQVSKNVCKG